jgi:hypothetical protein
MKVKLLRNWYSPQGILYASRHNPHDVPDELEEFLPSTAKVEKSGKWKEPKRAEVGPDETPVQPLVGRAPLLEVKSDEKKK